MPCDVRCPKRDPLKEFAVDGGFVFPRVEDARGSGRIIRVGEEAVALDDGATESINENVRRIEVSERLLIDQMIRCERDRLRLKEHEG